jgi:anti-anti-sigma factor
VETVQHATTHQESSVGIALEQRDESSLVRLEGSIDIACAADLKALLVEALTSAKDVQVSLAGATYLDVTAVELLWAAAREARGKTVKFAFADEVPESVSGALLDAGFEKFPVPVSRG